MLVYIKFICTLIITIISAIFSCYKYLKKELDKKADKDTVIKEFDNVFTEVEKKVDKILYEKEIEFLKNQINDSNKSLCSKLEELRDDMKIIKEVLLKKQGDFMTKDNISKNDITKKILFEIIEKSLNDLSIYERELINRDVHEDCINHRFAFYLEINLGLFFNIENHKKLSEIYNLSVDAEYNKNYKEPKRYGDKTSYAIPDIIIHQRNSNDYNLLMVEAKKEEYKKKGSV